ncbi:MAG: SDR family oxidoreductase [Elusimicrobia bacterium]|nr:SDR family oxidoreductase [Elusimicrobiota bacterium]
MDLQIKDRVAWVAGASRGIGLAVARRLAEEGCRVALSGRDAPALAAARLELEKVFGAGRIAAFPGDAAAVDGAAAAVRGCQERWGRLDILVANAGTGKVPPGALVSDEDWDLALRQNLRTAVQAARQAMPLLAASGAGCIVLVGSIAGLEAIGAPAAYAAAKSALQAWAKSLSREAAPRRVRVNTVLPGNVLFPGGSWQSRLDKEPERTWQDIRREVPMGRFGTPEEIADAVAFLASERAAFITGAALVVDGGQTRSHP